MNGNSPLRSTRIATGQSLGDVSRATGIDRATLSRIERCLQTAGTQQAERLTQHFGGRISELEILYPERYMPGDGKNEAA